MLLALVRRVCTGLCSYKLVHCDHCMLMFAKQSLVVLSESICFMCTPYKICSYIVKYKRNYKQNMNFRLAFLKWYRDAP